MADSDKPPDPLTHRFPGFDFDAFDAEVGEIDIDAARADDPGHDEPADDELPPRLAKFDAAVEYTRVVFPRLYPGETPELQRIGRFEAIVRLGRGGYGVVYLARDPELDRLVAVKLCPEPQADAVERFRREAKLLARFSHPNIVTVYEVGLREQDVFYAMEYVAGGNGNDFASKRPSWQGIVDLYEAAATGLAAAHGEGVVHGDFKPANVLWDDDGRVRVADFGLARIAGESACDNHRRGTLPFMAPEVLLGLETDARADQWSLCVSVWMTLHLEFPFQGSTTAELLESIERGPESLVFRPRTPAPEALGEILRKGLALQKEDRYPDMHALIDALQGLRRPLPKAAGPGWGSFLALGLASVASVIGALVWSHRAVTIEVEPSVPQTHCVSNVSEQSAAVAEAACLLIREGRFEDAHRVWLTEYDARVAEIEQAFGTAARMRREVLANDTEIVAQTFAAQAAATFSNEWKLMAAAIRTIPSEDP